MDALIASEVGYARDRLRATLRAERDIEIMGEAEDGPSAIQLAHELRPEVLLLDLSIPGTLSGLEVLRELARALPDVRIVVVSVDTRLRAAALSGGAAAFVWKGVSPGELLQEVRKFARSEERERPLGPQRLGEHLLAQGIITRDQLAAALARQRRLQRRGQPRKLGELLREQGTITQAELERTLRHRGPSRPQPQDAPSS